MRKTVMMALRDSERASLGKHFNIIVAFFVFVYPFPFTHFFMQAYFLLHLELCDSFACQLSIV